MTEPLKLNGHPLNQAALAHLSAMKAKPMDNVLYVVQLALRAADEFPTSLDLEALIDRLSRRSPTSAMRVLGETQELRNSLAAELKSASNPQEAMSDLLNHLNLMASPTTG